MAGVLRVPPMRDALRLLPIALALALPASAGAEEPVLGTTTHESIRGDKAPKPKIENGFGHALWRMSATKVAALYPDAKPAEGGLSLETEVMGRPALVAMYFADHFGLSRVLVLFKDSLRGAGDAMRVFDEVDFELGIKYGPPTQSTEWWAVKPSKMTEQARQQSLASGGLKIASTWAGARTWILLSVGTTATQDAPGTTLTFLSADAPLSRDWQNPAGASATP
jgi:hypothetical protein